MAVLLWLLVTLVPCLLGMGALRLIYGSQTTREMNLSDCVLTGGMVLIGLAEAAHLAAVILGWSFSRCAKIFGLAVVILCLFSLFLVFLNRREWMQTLTGTGFNLAGDRSLFLLRMGLVLGVLSELIFVIVFRRVYLGGDMTLETVVSFLDTDAVYLINPLTGEAYSQGMPFRLKILCLPFLYAALSSLFGIDPEFLVYGLVPAFVLLGSCLAFDSVGRFLFPEDRRKRVAFLLLTVLLLGVGDYMYGMDGFGLLHGGFRGVAIRGGILLPYTVGLMLRRKYRSVLLCILAEACMVWTLYGLGACLAVAVGMSVVTKVVGILQARGGKEAST